MGYQVLARKWRPKKFQDVIGQEAITRSLQNAIKRGRLGHAYLFTGTRGIGKTSVARLFAQAIRCESLSPDGNACGICEACQDTLRQNSMNIIEIDGASNNTVDEIRELINNVQYLPTSGTYKVYIIDEVHMLSKSAFNALLKTLEEPPAHVIFLLATTEPQKLLGTVLSRCQRFDFVNASIESLKKHLISIAKEEGIIFESEQMVLDIARLGQGSFRDTLSLLDQVLSFTSDNRISEEVLSQSLGVVRRQLLQEIIANILQGEDLAALAGCRKALSENISVKALMSAILDGLFESIEHIDDPAWLDDNDQVAQAISTVDNAELFWIYESLARESVWLFDSLSSEQTFLLLIKKTTLRRELLGIEQSSPRPQNEVKKKTLSPKPERLEEPHTVDGFVKLVEAQAAALATSLEHAKLSPHQLDGASELEITYPSDSEVFHEVVNEEFNRNRLEKILHEYLGRQLPLKIELVKKDEVRTRAQDRLEQTQKDDEIRRQEIMLDPMLKMAQEMFNTKIDRIQLEKKGE